MTSEHGMPYALLSFNHIEMKVNIASSRKMWWQAIFYQNEVFLHAMHLIYVVECYLRDTYMDLWVGLWSFLLMNCKTNQLLLQTCCAFLVKILLYILYIQQLWNEGGKRL